MDKKVAIVTGAGSGVGRAVGLSLLREGYHVALAGRRKDALEKVVAEAGDARSRALAIPTDVCDPQAIRALFAQTKSAFGRLDLLFNNAGIGAADGPRVVVHRQSGARDDAAPRRARGIRRVIASDLDACGDPGAAAQLRELLRAAAAYAAGGRQALLLMSKTGSGAAKLLGQMK